MCLPGRVLLGRLWIRNPGLHDETNIVALVLLNDLRGIDYGVIMPCMRAVNKIERRQEERFPQNLEMKLRELPDIEAAGDSRSAILSGRIQNISQRGVCIVTTDPLKVSSVLRCEIPICESQPRVTTLMRVRWTRKQDFMPEGFISGLETLL